MPLLQSAVSLLVKQLPQTIEPRTHAILDYALAGGFIAAGAFFWKRHRRAALGSLACGAALTASSLLTDYPGGVVSSLSYKTHRKVDTAVIAIASAFPSAMFFRDDPQAKFFVAAGIAGTILISLTAPSHGPHSGERYWESRKTA